MKRRIASVNWREEWEKIAELSALGNDFILIDNSCLPTFLNSPFKLDNMVISIMCLKGTMKGNINMNPFYTNGPGLLIILQDQVFQYESFSKDFSACFFIMSESFAGNLFQSARETMPVFLSIFDDPWIPLNEQALEAILDFHILLKKALQIEDNPYRGDVVKHLLNALFYGAGYYFHRSKKERKTKHELLIDKFLKLLRSNYKTHRKVEFYADKLFLTPKYLSKIVKMNSGKSVNEWVDEYVILEAKALLKSGASVKEVSDQLCFPSQSFFGKYFKRLTGSSPKEYTRKNVLW